MLIPVSCLTNGISIRREETASEVTYYHVELASHDILLAEGLPSESYLDDGNRAAFDGGGAFLMLHPDYAPKSGANACAPVRENGPKVAAAQRRLRARLRALGYRTSGARRIEVWADCPLRPRFARRGLYHFHIPAGVAKICIVSASGVPAGMFDNSADNRTLGAQIGLVILDGQWIPLDAPMLAAGFHAVEQDAAGSFRWTDGRATLRLPLPSGAPRRLELYVRSVMRSWSAPGAARARRAA